MSKTDKLREFFRYAADDKEAYPFCNASDLLENYFEGYGLDWQSDAEWNAWFPAAEEAFEAEDGR